jgi:hypothetical protein
MVVICIEFNIRMLLLSCFKPPCARCNGAVRVLGVASQVPQKRVATRACHVLDILKCLSGVLDVASYLRTTIALRSRAHSKSSLDALVRL